MPAPVAGPTIWLDATVGVFKDAGVTPAAFGDSVQQWNDQSGNGNNATQSTSGQRPIYATGVARGNLPGLNFDNNDDGMTTGATINAPYTVFAVYKALSTSGNHRAVQGFNNWTVAPYQGFHILYANGWVEQNTGPIVDGFSIVRTVARGTGSATTFFVNGINVTNDSSPTGAPGVFALAATGGTADPLNGYLCEVLVYSSALSSTDQHTVDQYLADKWQSQEPYYRPQKPASIQFNRNSPLYEGLLWACAFNQISGATIRGIASKCSPLIPMNSGLPARSGGGVAFNGTTYARTLQGPALANGAFTVFLLAENCSFAVAGAWLGLGSGSTDQQILIRGNTDTSLLCGNFGDAVAVNVPSMTSRRIAVCYTQDSSKVKTTYLDGINYGSRTGSGLFTGSAVLGVGTFADPAGGQLAMTAQLVLIWNRALPAAQVAQLQADPFAPVRPRASAATTFASIAQFASGKLAGSGGGLVGGYLAGHSGPLVA